MRLRRVVVAAGLVGGIVLAAPGVASAHPLGNFTINQASAIRVGRQHLVIEHIVDMAEIPTFQTRSDIDTNHDGSVSVAEGERWASPECRRIGGKLDLEVDGTAAVLTPRAAAVSFPPGQAGLSTLRLVCRFDAPAAAGTSEHRIRLVNRNFTDRIGWREITAVGDRTTLAKSGIPKVSPSASLTKYPTDRLSSPLDQRSADLRYSLGGTAAPKRTVITSPTGSVVRGFDHLTESLTSSVTARRLTFGIALLALAFSIGLGALHAFAPGHGKTVMAAYLVGERGTVRDGLLIGVTVATTHTLGVLVLGGVLTASQTFAPETIYPYLSLASGVCFAGLGLALFVGALRRRRSGLFALGHHHHHGLGGHDHGHRYDDRGHDHETDHDHDHAHDHEHDHGHEHVETEAANPLSRRSLLTLGFAGGLVPTPTAVVVLLGATAIGRAWFGAVLVLAYGIGMGATLVLAGLLLARARRRFDLSRHGDRAMRIAAFFPVATAAVITTSGLWLVARAAISF